MIESSKSYPELIKNLPSEVKLIFKSFLQEQESSIRLVGGCVRDLLLQKKISDFDFATKFLPQEVIKILQKNSIAAVPTGLKHGTITAVINRKNFEITTLRKDFDADGRHCNAEFVNDYEQDALRRDFTINALYLDEKGQIFDYCDGMADLKMSKVRFIGNANERIREDYLRILRFFRFSCFYAKSFDVEAIEACKLLKSSIKQLSKERIRGEIFKIFACQNDDKLIETLAILEETKIRHEFLPMEVNLQDLRNFFAIEEEFFRHKSLIESLSTNYYLLKFFITISNNLNKDRLLEISNSLLLTRKELIYCQLLLAESLQVESIFDLGKIKTLLVNFENDKELVLALFKANLTNNFLDIDIFKNQILTNIEFIRNFTLPEFPLKGDDLIAVGITGKEIGRVLRKTKTMWINSDFSLSKAVLMDVLNNG